MPASPQRTRGGVISPRRLALALVAAVALGAAPAHAETVTFTTPGIQHAYFVPTGVSRVHIVVVGAPAGGRGAVVTADVPVVSDEQLTAVIGADASDGGGGNDATSTLVAAQSGWRAIAAGGDGGSSLSPSPTGTIALDSGGVASVTITTYEPILDLAPTRLAFDRQALRHAQTKSFVVANRGNEVLMLNRSLIGGNDSRGSFTIVGDTCASGIAPAASCTVTVRFQPLVVGVHYATVLVGSQLLRNSPALVSLHGEGGPPVPPRLTALRISKLRFAPGAHATVSFRVDEDARVQLRVMALKPGVRRGGTCAVAAPGRHGRRCTRLVPYGKTVRLRPTAGTIRQKLGRLPPGRYRVRITVVGDGGTSSALTPAFRIVRKR
ncbi:MAG TPA: choice-of-anchor D domain-containing protein [Solirubrobacteraceae bacterium]